jgi:hypothetical protein
MALRRRSKLQPVVQTTGCFFDFSGRRGLGPPSFGGCARRTFMVHRFSVLAPEKIASALRRRPKINDFSDSYGGARRPSKTSER